MTGIHTVCSPASRLPIPVIQVMLVMIATVLVIGTSTSASSTPSNEGVPSSP